MFDWITKDIPTFDWKNLNGKTLKIHVEEDSDSGCLVVAGKDVETGDIYVLHEDFSEKLKQKLDNIVTSDEVKHPSRYLVIENTETCDLFRYDVRQPFPNGYRKFTHSIPAPEKYWELPIYQAKEI